MTRSNPPEQLQTNLNESVPEGTPPTYASLWTATGGRECDDTPCDEKHDMQFDDTEWCDDTPCDEKHDMRFEDTQSCDDAQCDEKHDMRFDDTV